MPTRWGVDLDSFEFKVGLSSHGHDFMNHENRIMETDLIYLLFIGNFVYV